MIRDRGMRLVAAMVAGLLVAFLAGLLLVSGARPGAAPPVPAAPPEPREAPAAETPPSPPPSAPAEDPGPEAEPLEDEDGGATVVLGTSVLEDGSPFPGVLFLEMATAEGGGWEVDLAADAPVDRSAVPNEFRFRWKEPRAEVVLLVLGRTAECIAAEGAAIVGLEERGEVVRFTPGVPARLVFRDLPGGPVRLLLDGTAGSAPLEVELPSVELLAADGTSLPPGGAKVFFSSSGAPPLDPGATLVGRGGRVLSVEGAVMEIALEFPVLPRSERGDGDRRTVVLKMPFFEPVRLPAAEIVDGMRVPLIPLRPSVTAVLSPPPDPGCSSGISLVPAGETASAGPEGGETEVRIGEDGTVAIYRLPPGEWELRVMRGTAEGFRWGERRFRIGDDPVDLGAVEASGYAGLRVRLLDRDNGPIPGGRFSVSRAGRREAVASSGVELRGLAGPRGGALIVHPDFFTFRVQSGERDPEGWFEVPDLAPGTRYRVGEDADGAPGEEITTGTENGSWVEVELRPRDTKGK